VPTAAGFTCDAGHGGGGLGECLPAAPGAAGRPCDGARLATRFAALGDAYVEAPLEACAGGGICAPARAGFPGGLCATLCDGAPAPTGSRCVGVPTLGPFTLCVQRTGAVRDCAHRFHVAAAMPACRSAADCRRDYACVTDQKGDGFCAPPYVVPELTLVALP
jgi:hypothetical protein